MGDDQHAERGAQAKEGESILGCRVVGVVQQYGMIVGEDGPRLVERHAMFADILPGLCGVPFDANVIHASVYGRCMYDTRARLGIGSFMRLLCRELGKDGITAE